MEGQASNPPPKGKEHVFYKHEGWDHIHIDEKGGETWDRSWGKREHADIYVPYMQTYMYHIPHIHFETEAQHQNETKFNPWHQWDYLRTRRRGYELSPRAYINWMETWAHYLGLRNRLFIGWNIISWPWVQTSAVTTSEFVSEIWKDTRAD